MEGLPKRPDRRGRTQSRFPVILSVNNPLDI